MKFFSLTISKQVPIIQLSPDIVTKLSYISIIVAVAIFLIGCYRIYKKRMYGLRMLISSFLLLINPIINFVLS
jgi:NADH:ubiquinone oxidoreductase subunit K